MSVVVHGYKIYRTENILLKGVPHTVRFSVRDDGDEHILFVINDMNGNRAKGKYSKEQAKDFKKLKGDNLEAKVQEVMIDYIQTEMF